MENSMTPHSSEYQYQENQKHLVKPVDSLLQTLLTILELDAALSSEVRYTYTNKVEVILRKIMGKKHLHGKLLTSRNQLVRNRMELLTSSMQRVQALKDSYLHH